MKKSKNGLSPESLMMGFGHNPENALGALKIPIYPTSTFVFKSAKEGEIFFRVAYGLDLSVPPPECGFIYSRLGNPNLDVVERRIALWDGAESSAIFASGLAAITSVFFEFLNHGDLLVVSSPLYGGSDHYISKILTKKLGINIISINGNQTQDEIVDAIKESGMADKLAMVFIETPSNPTNSLFNIAELKNVAELFSTSKKQVLLAVDNTYLGPVFQHPLKYGADLVVYSATKYIGGHSDLIAGFCSGSKELIQRLKCTRTFWGNMSDPNTAWMIARSLETLKIRMQEQAKNAKKIARFLNRHPLVEKVFYLGNLTSKDGRPYQIKERQCLSDGAMIAFEIKGGKTSAFKFLNALAKSGLIKLAVSLGGTESLVEHPKTMTHADVDEQSKDQLGVTDSLIRLSVGIENPIDLIKVLKQAFVVCG